jgi:hypothetical protein
LQAAHRRRRAIPHAQLPEQVSDMHFDGDDLYSQLVGNGFVIIAEDEVMEDLLLADREPRSIVISRRLFIGGTLILTMIFTIRRHLVRRAKFFVDHVRLIDLRCWTQWPAARV